MAMYDIINITTHGAGHIKRGEPCEDYSISVARDFYKIFVVADGHGDSNCPRSSLGSEYICKIASEELDEFAQSINNEKWEQRLFLPEYQEKLIRHLITSIIGKWKETVVEEYMSNPLTEEERAGCDRYIQRYDAGERIEHIYGSTMIAGLMTKDYLLLLQQGDGRCDVFDAKGNVSQPIPWDDRCFANVCTSLCDSDAIESCRYYVVDIKEEPIAAVMAGSDGVEDSFPNMDLVHSYYRDLLMLASDSSIENLINYLKETLPEFSENGSRDDVSIGGFIDLEMIGKLTSKFKCDNIKVEVNSRLRMVDDRIRSMESGKMEYLEQKYAKAKLEYQSLRNDESKEKYFAIEEEFKQYRERYESYLAQREEILSELKQISDNDSEDTGTEETESNPVIIEEGNVEKDV
jgi:hypothetical protein